MEGLLWVGWLSWEKEMVRLRLGGDWEALVPGDRDRGECLDGEWQGWEVDSIGFDIVLDL
jgi:hypothetical protein